MNPIHMIFCKMIFECTRVWTYLKTIFHHKRVGEIIKKTNLTNVAGLYKKVTAHTRW
jgi:hypothetical protein